MFLHHIRNRFWLLIGSKIGMDNPFKIRRNKEREKLKKLMEEMQKEEYDFNNNPN